MALAWALYAAGSSGEGGTMTTGVFEYLVLLFTTTAMITPTVTTMDITADTTMTTTALVASDMPSTVSPFWVLLDEVVRLEPAAGVGVGVGVIWAQVVHAEEKRARQSRKPQLVENGWHVPVPGPLWHHAHVTLAALRLAHAEQLVSDVQGVDAVGVGVEVKVVGVGVGVGVFDAVEVGVGVEVEVGVEVGVGVVEEVEQKAQLEVVTLVHSDERQLALVRSMHRPGLRVDPPFGVHHLQLERWAHVAQFVAAPQVE